MLCSSTRLEYMHYDVFLNKTRVHALRCVPRQDSSTCIMLCSSTTLEYMHYDVILDKTRVHALRCVPQQDSSTCIMYMLLFVSFLTTLFSCGHIWTIVGRRGQTSWLPRRQERPLLMKKSTRPSLNSNRSEYIYIYQDF